MAGRKRGAVADKSIEKYEQVVHDFLSHLGDRADLTLAAIGPKDVRAFRDALAKGARSPDTVNQNIRKVLTAPFLPAVRLGYISANPCAAVERLRDDSDGEREVFSPEQVAGLIEVADDEWRGVILCGYFTGLRLRDVVNLKWEAVDFDRSLRRVRTEKTGATIMLPLQKLSGHADERSHARYTHHEIEVLRAAVAKLPGLAVAG